MKKTGLFFGTFNPVHIGHLAIANHIVENTDLEEIWMVITPQNPFKTKSNLLDKYQRYEMVFRATKNYNTIKPSSIEFDLPQPNYTTKTLAFIEEKYPNHSFSLIMGQDNINSIHKWKNADFILENYNIIVYPRPNSEPYKKIYPNTTFLKDVPLMDISASFIRQQIKDSKNISPLLPLSVWEYITEMNFYKTSAQAK